MSRLNPTETQITRTEDLPWRVPLRAPPDSVAEAVMAGGEDQDGSYLVLMKWYPGWMSAPHTYVTDRLCVVVSEVWWCKSGRDFDPTQAVPVYPGGFVRRVARTPHYDGAHPQRRRARNHRRELTRPGRAGLGGSHAARAAKVVTRSTLPLRAEAM